MTEITQAEIEELYYDIDLMAALKGDTIPTRAQGQGVTILEYATACSISESTAARRLNELVSAGEFERVEMIDRGRLKNVFVRAE